MAFSSESDRSALSIAKYAGQAATLGPSCETVQSRLKYALENHRQKAVEIERLLGLLERNPDIEEILNLTRSLL